MNPMQERFESVGVGHSQEHRLARYLRDRPGEWVAMPELALVVTPTGVGAVVHSRVAAVRRRFGMTVLHRGGTNPTTGLRVSEYCYVPEQADAQNAA